MKSNKLPNFGAYLDYALRTTVPKRKGLPNIAGFLAFAGMITGFYFGVDQIFSLIPTILLTVFVGLPLVGSITTWIDSLMKRPRNSIEHEEVRQHGVVTDLFSRAESRKLHKELDPSAAQLLEACAYYWSAVHRSLTGPAWGSDENLGGHYAMLRQQSLQAADQAMLEATLLCAQCVGQPQRKKSEDLKEAFEDLFDLDWEDALDNFRRVAKAESHEYAHQSPNIKQVFYPVRDIAERLKLLAQEVEKVSSEIVHSKVALPGSGAVSSIDLVLKEFQLSRQAEAELEQRLNQGGG
ncbi:MAG: hypothetical protein HONBIEJF_02030 [Fimbriimonadaceae bacterium]|nr:hypothetical protein [Fimbriimonadaceae bacterium]